MTAPRFHPDLPSLKAMLRLTPVDTGDGAAVLDSAIEEVGILMERRLGADRIAEILAIDWSVERSDRRVAAVIEHLWVRLILSRRLPMLFIQAQNSAQQAWNEEGITRDMSEMDLRNLRRDLMATIEEYLADLRGEETGSITATAFGPEDPVRPYDSIRPTFTGVLL